VGLRGGGGAVQPEGKFESTLIKRNPSRRKDEVNISARNIIREAMAEFQIWENIFPPV
jgi:hypothetical protein